jgi:cobalt-zinc-cadmium efflux system protein
MGDNHNHSHSHGTNYGRIFGIGVALNLLFVIVEFLFGKWSNSVALVADAGHNLSDALGLTLAWAAAVLTRRSPTPNRTYGLRRSSILAAVINASLLMIVVGAIVWEAFGRLGAPEPVASKTVIIVAAIGILINTFTGLLFLSGNKKDLNVRAAFMHLMADALVSLGVVLAGVVILATGWQTLDPLISLMVSVVIVIGTWQLLRDSLNLALDAVPESVNIHEVRTYLEDVPGCTNVHDLHIWAMSTTETALTAHLIVEDLNNNDILLAQITHDLHDKFGIEHATLQLENGDPDFFCHCRLLTT